VVAAALGEGTTDPGTVATRDGARVKVRVLVPEGQSPPRVMLTVMHAGEPRYARSRLSSGEAEVSVAGLGRGTFDVHAGPFGGTRGLSERVVTLDLR
jgi:hypothetical protein